MLNQRKQQNLRNNVDAHLTFGEHVAELRSRLFIIAACISLATLIGYFIQQQLVALMLLPSKGQNFIFTSPTGGINFLFQVCLYFGIYISLPVIIFNILKFIQPLLSEATEKLIGKYSFYSFVLATLGILFGYYAGLPFALHFLSGQFTSHQIQALYTINEYGSFVSFYLLGSALLFQLFLIILFINRIKPIEPKSLLTKEKYVVAGAFIVSFIMVPAPNIANQLVLAAPIILLYQISIAVIAFRNRKLSYTSSSKQIEPEIIVNKQPTRQPVLITDIIRLQPNKIVQ
jgi:sec-independent protein translocase protein TatC